MFVCMFVYIGRTQYFTMNVKNPNCNDTYQMSSKFVVVRRDDALNSCNRQTTKHNRKPFRIISIQ